MSVKHATSGMPNVNKRVVDVTGHFVTLLPQKEKWKRNKKDMTEQPEEGAVDPPPNNLPGAIVSIIASIIIQIGNSHKLYFKSLETTKKEEKVKGLSKTTWSGLVAALGGVINAVPVVFMKTPTGVVMPLEVFQALTAHFLPLGLTYLKEPEALEPRNEKISHVLIVLIVVCGLVASFMGPKNIRETQVWKRYHESTSSTATNEESTSSKATDVSEVKSFQTDKEFVVVNLSEHDKLNGADFVKNGDKVFRRLSPAETLAYRFDPSKRAGPFVITMIQACGAVAHFIFTLSLKRNVETEIKEKNKLEESLDKASTIKNDQKVVKRDVAEPIVDKILCCKKTIQKISYKDERVISVIWGLVAAFTAGALLNVHSGNAWTQHSSLHFPSLGLTVAGALWVFSQMEIATNSEYIHPIALKIMSIFFIVAAATHGMMFNDEHKATNNLPGYLTCIVLLCILSFMYVFFTTPRSKAQEEPSFNQVLKDLGLKALPVREALAVGRKTAPTTQPFPSASTSPSASASPPASPPASASQPPLTPLNVALTSA